MKEVTVIVNAQMTQIMRNLSEEEAYKIAAIAKCPDFASFLGKDLEETTNIDDVLVRNVQVFIGDVKDEEV